VKDWIAIVISALALLVSAAAFFEARREEEPRLHLRILTGYTERGCPTINLAAANESSSAITIAPPFIADTQIRRRTGPLWFLEPGNLVIPLRRRLMPGRHARTAISDQLLFLRPKEAVEYEHDLSNDERVQLISPEARVVAVVTDYSGHVWTESLQNIDADFMAHLRRRPPVGCK
jgi:hypothetical protein